MRSHFMGTFLCVAMGVAMTAAGQVPAQVIPAIDLHLRPITQNVGINETARVGLYAVSNSPEFNQSFLGVAIVLSWDPNRLRLLGDETPSPSPWSSSGFPFGVADPHSLNETVPPQDGTGLWQAFGQLGSSISATPGGTLITTFRFKPIVLSSGTVVQVLPEGGIPLTTSSGGVIRQDTIVLDFFSPGLNVVGILRPTTLSISQGGGGTTAPFIVSRNPQSGQVINTVSGISSIVVQFDRNVSTSSIQVTGVNNSVGFGTLLGAGSSTHSLQFSGSLPDQDLYTVSVSADGLFDQWQFRVLVGDCNQDGVVNIFDLGGIRDLLRNGTFDPNCNIDDRNNNLVINIFDLGLVRTALRNGSSAP